MSTASIFTCGDLAFSGSGPSSDGYGLAEIEGWYSGVEADSSLTERLAAGASMLGFLPRKPFTVRGWYEGANLRDARQAAADLMALRGSSAPIVCSYSEEGDETTRRAVLVRPDLDYQPWMTSFDFALDFLAPDPRRYGPMTWTSHISRTSVAVTNSGTAPCPLSVLVTRSATQQNISVPGTTAVFSRPLADGSTLSLDGEAMEVYLNGSRALGMQSLKWPIVPPMSSVSVTVTGASAFSVGVRDAWW